MRRFLPRRVLLAAAVLAAAVVAPRTVFGGVGAGNEYNHFVNPGFDFHIAAPRTWACDNCESAFDARPAAKGKHLAEEATLWRLEAPEATSWIDIAFISDFPAENEAELLTAIQARHPDVEWYGFDRGRFVGYTSTNAGDAANEATEYYLVDKRLVIKLSWKKDGDLPDRAREIDLIKYSIDRSSAPAKIKAIRTEKDGAYKVGDTACFDVEVDDLRSGYDAQSLEDFRIVGTPDHWNFKTVAWVGENNWFKVCYVVLSSFGADGLQVRGLRVSTGNSTLSCEQPKAADSRHAGPTDLLCASDDGESARVAPDVAPVDNPSPDQEGPAITALELDAEKMTLKITASDAAGLGMGEATGRLGTTPFYPDQLTAGVAVDIAASLGPGWNTIERLVVFDGNGLPTMLRAPKAAKRRAAHLEAYTYERVSWSGRVEPTSLPVLYFLKKGPAK
jgi:hypothetical protein